VSCVLNALGELSTVAGEAMLPHIHELLPLIISSFQDQASVTKREVALRALGQLIESTGYAIQPLIGTFMKLFHPKFHANCFPEYPKLLEILMNALQTESSLIIRREVIKVIGILGAVDPYRYKVK